MRRIEPYFLLTYGILRDDDRLIVSTIIFIIKNSLQWRESPRSYRLHKTIYNRFVRWSRLGVFNFILVGLAGKAAEPDRIMIEATHLKAPHDGKPLKRGSSLIYGRNKGGLNSKLHAVCDGKGRTIAILLAKGQMSNHNGAVLLFDVLPREMELSGDQGYDNDWFRAGLAARSITPSIPPKSNCKVQYHYD